MIAKAIDSTVSDFIDDRDRQTEAAVMSVLASSQYASLRRLDCRVSNGVVEITGIVSSYFLKQLAQAAVMQLHQANSVRNLVEVDGEPSILVAKSCAQEPAHGTA